MWVLTFAVAVSLLAFLGMALWQGQLVTRALSSRDCAQCGTPLEALTQGPGADPEVSYEVLACATCADVVTTLHGARSAFAYCPSCRQRTLKIGARTRGPAPVGSLPRVRVDEECDVCGYRGQRDLPDTAKGESAGQVIPFPRR